MISKPINLIKLRLIRNVIPFFVDILNCNTKMRNTGKRQKRVVILEKSCQSHQT